MISFDCNGLTWAADLTEDYIVHSHPNDCKIDEDVSHLSQLCHDRLLHNYVPQVRALVGYVPQDDVLPGTSTVWEFLSFHAALRLPGAGSAVQGARVWQV